MLVTSVEKDSLTVRLFIILELVCDLFLVEMTLITIPGKSVEIHLY